jgi:hypothetical protein
MALAGEKEALAEVVGFVAEQGRTARGGAWDNRNVERSKYTWLLPSTKRTQQASTGKAPQLVPLDAWGFKYLPVR